MANQLFPKGKEAFLSGAINLTSDTIKAVLVDLADYTYNAAHDFLDDVPVAARVATSPALASKTVTNGVFDAADVTFASVTGDPCEAIILFKDTGNAATSLLIAYIDTATNLPVTPVGANIPIAWSVSGIFTL